jgi:CrcB protein
MAAQLLLLAAGGAIGTVGRYLVSSLAFRWFHGAFPVGTLAVNLLGSLAAGFLWGWFERAAVPPHLRLFLLAGVLGGFTTFSAFSLENLNLLRAGEVRIAVWNIVITNALCLAMAVAGFVIARAFGRAALP